MAHKLPGAETAVQRSALQRGRGDLAEPEHAGCEASRQQLVVRRLSDELDHGALEGADVGEREVRRKRRKLLEAA